MADVVYLQDRFVEPRDAHIALGDAGYLLGDGVFATLRAYDGVCFRAVEHVAILLRGCERLGIDPKASPTELSALADEAARRVGSRDAYVRITVTRGPGDGFKRAPRESSHSTLSILGRDLDLPPEEAYAAGIPATIVTPRRVPPACMDGTIKTTSYAGPVLARREALSRGCPEGIQLAIDGTVACGTMSNVFIVQGSSLVTPPRETGCREGVVRRLVLSLAHEIGLTATEDVITIAQLEDAEEVFLTNSRIECLPIATIDGRAIGAKTRGADPSREDSPDSAFPRTQRLRELVHRAAMTESITKRTRTP